MTTHTAMLAWGAAVEVLRQAEATRDAAMTAARAAGGYLGHDYTTTARDYAFIAAMDAAEDAERAYLSGAGGHVAWQLLRRLVGDKVRDDDVPAIEAVIAAVLASPAGPFR